MRKKLLVTALLLLVTSAIYAQVYQSTGNYGNAFKRVRTDTVSFLPVFNTPAQLFTTFGASGGANTFDRPGALAYVRLNKSFYQYDSAGVWVRMANKTYVDSAIASVGSSFDTTYLYAQLDLIHDSTITAITWNDGANRITFTRQAGNFNIYLTGFADSTTTVTALAGKVDSVTKSGTSYYYWKGAVSTLVGVDQDAQTLSGSRAANIQTITISGGNSVGFTVADADSVSTNELQTLSFWRGDDTLHISNGNTVYLYYGHYADSLYAVLSTAIAGKGDSLITNVAFTDAQNKLTFTRRIGDLNVWLTGFADSATAVYTTGSYANPAWITSISWSKITGTPTTAAGYGITDVYRKGEVDTLVEPTYRSGQKFTDITLNTSASLFVAVAYGDGIFLGIKSASDSIYRSEDGYTWIPTVISTLPIINAPDLIYANGTFLLTSNQPTSNLLYSTDKGLTWTAQTIGGGSVGVRAAGYGSGTWVVSVSSGTNRIYTSTDLTTWTGRTSDAAVYTGIAYGEGLFVAVGSSKVITSPDGITWTTRTHPATAIYSDVEYGNGRFVSISTTGGSGMYSWDGITWTGFTPAVVNGASQVHLAYGNGVFVWSCALGSGSAYSIDGITWSLPLGASISANRSSYVAFGNGIFILARAAAGVLAVSRAYSGDIPTITNILKLDNRSLVDLKVPADPYSASWANNDEVLTKGDAYAKFLTTSSSNTGDTLITAATFTDAQNKVTLTRRAGDLNFWITGFVDSATNVAALVLKQNMSDTSTWDFTLSDYNDAIASENLQAITNRGWKTTNSIWSKKLLVGDTTMTTNYRVDSTGGIVYGHINNSLGTLNALGRGSMAGGAVEDSSIIEAGAAGGTRAVGRARTQLLSGVNYKGTIKTGVNSADDVSGYALGGTLYGNATATWIRGATSASNATEGMITTSGVGFAPEASGYSFGGLIGAYNSGAKSHGYTVYLSPFLIRSEISTTGIGAMTDGVVFGGGKMSTTLNGGHTFGSAESDGQMLNDGAATTMLGIANKGIMQMEHFAHNRPSDPAHGGLLVGHSWWAGSYLASGGDGTLTGGEVNPNYRSINSIPTTNTTTGQTVGDTLYNGGTASIVWGTDMVNNADYSYMFGAAMRNDTARQFMVGWGTNQFVVDGKHNLLMNNGDTMATDLYARNDTLFKSQSGREVVVNSWVGDCPDLLTWADFNDTLSISPTCAGSANGYIYLQLGAVDNSGYTIYVDGVVYDLDASNDWYRTGTHIVQIIRNDHPSCFTTLTLELGGHAPVLVDAETIQDESFPGAANGKMYIVSSGATNVTVNGIAYNPALPQAYSRGAYIVHAWSTYAGVQCSAYDSVFIDTVIAQREIQYKDEGTNVGNKGMIDTVDFVGSGVTVTSPNAHRLTVTVAGGVGGGSYTDEEAQDAVATLIQNGTGITWSYNDGSNTLTPTVTITQYTDALARTAVIDQDIIDGELNKSPSDDQVYDALASKQVTLVSGTNIKTVNGNSLLGSSNVSVQPNIQFKDEGATRGSLGGITEVDFVGAAVTATVASNVLTVTITSSGGIALTDISATGPLSWNSGTGVMSIPVATSLADGYLDNADFATFSGKQDALVSATNIKTINGSSILGAGNLTVTGGHTIQSNSSDMTSRAKLNFSTHFLLSDNSGNNSTDVDVDLSGTQPHDGDLDAIAAIASNGILKRTASNTWSIATAGTDYVIPSGSVATLTTPRAIYGNNFDGSAALAQIIASTYGGTGNGFTKFSGPASTEKTFTLPNASATILTDNAVVTGAQGGTGVNNSGKTVTLGGNFTTSGAFATTLTSTATTNVTLPTTGTLITKADVTLNKGITIISPTSSENATVWKTPVAITISSVERVMLGTSPSVTYVINYGSSRTSATGTIVASNTATTTGTATLNTTSIPANSYIWVTTSASSGTIDEFHLDVNFTIQ